MIHILDKQTDRIEAFLQKEVIEAIHDESIDLQETFDFTTFVSEKTKYATERNRVIIKAEDDSFREFIIIRVESEADKVYAFSDAAYLDLDKLKVIPPIVLDGQTIESAVNHVLLGTEYKLGIAEFSGSRKITIDNHIGAFQALKQLGTAFDCELRFRVETDGNVITGRYVDFFKKRGEFKGKEIVFGKDLLGVKRIEDSDHIVTALHCLGPEKDDGTRIETIVTDDNAFQRWNRDGKHLWGIYEPESDDQNMTLARLKSLGTTELNKRINSYVKYEVTQAALDSVLGLDHEKVIIADTVKVKDLHYKPPLYLEARTHNVKRDLVDKSKKEYVLGDFIEYKEEDIRKRFDELQKRLRDKLSKMINVSIYSSNGVVFKNGQGSTKLRALAFYLGSEIDLEGTLYTYRWRKHDKNANDIPLNPYETKEITVNANDIDEYATYAVEIWSGNESHAISQITLTTVYDGLDGVGKPGPRGEPGLKGSNGADAITGMLTNESITLAADKDGNVVDFAPATGTFEIYEGLVKVPITTVKSNWRFLSPFQTANYMKAENLTFNVVERSGCTVSINHNGKYTVSSMNSDTAYAILTATYKDVIITKTLSLSKSKTGEQGLQGEQGPSGELNLINNPHVTGNIDGWLGSPTMVNRAFTDGSNINMLQSVSTGNTTIQMVDIEVDNSKMYEFSIWLQSDATTGQLYFGMYAYNLANVNVGSYQIPTNSGAKGSINTNQYGVNAVAPHTIWKRYTFYLIPAGINLTDMELCRNLGENNTYNFQMVSDTKKLTFRYLNWGNTSAAPKTVWAALPMLKEVDISVLQTNRAKNIQDLWRFEDTLEIDGANLRAKTITSNHISVNTLSALTANLGEVTAGSIKGVTITGSTINGSTFNSDGFYSNTTISGGTIKTINTLLEDMVAEVSFGKFTATNNFSGKKYLSEIDGNSITFFVENLSAFSMNTNEFVGGGSITGIQAGMIRITSSDFTIDTQAKMLEIKGNSLSTFDVKSGTTNLLSPITNISSSTVNFSAATRVNYFVLGSSLASVNGSIYYDSTNSRFRARSGSVGTSFQSVALGVEMIQSGSVNVGGTEGITSTYVAFSPSFPSTPHVVATPSTTVPGSVVIGWSVNGITKDGFTLYSNRTNTTMTGYRWIAVI